MPSMITPSPSTNSHARRPNVRIVTDSASQLDAEWALANRVALLPQLIELGGRAQREGIDLSDDELANQMVGMPYGHYPRVRPPGVDDFIKTYRALTQETSDIVSIHVSAHLSDTLRNARVAAEEFRGRANITVLDSMSVALGQNILVRKAAQLAQCGLPNDEIVRAIRGSVKHVYGAFIAEDLNYMAHSGTLRPAQAVLGKMLGIIPFLAIEEGEIVAIEKMRSVDRALEKLVEFAAEFEQPEQLAVLQLLPQHTDKTADLMSMLRTTFPRLPDIPLHNCGATIGSIVGPTGIGIMIYEGG